MQPLTAIGDPSPRVSAVTVSVTAKSSPCGCDSTSRNYDNDGPPYDAVRAILETRVPIPSIQLPSIIYMSLAPGTHNHEQRFLYLSSQKNKTSINGTLKFLPLSPFVGPSGLVKNIVGPIRALPRHHYRK